MSPLQSGKQTTGESKEKILMIILLAFICRKIEDGGYLWLDDLTACGHESVPLQAFSQDFSGIDLVYCPGIFSFIDKDSDVLSVDCKIITVQR